MTKTIRTTEVEIHRPYRTWRPRCVKSGTSKKEQNENGAVIEVIQATEARDMLIRTTEVGLNKAKKPWKPRRLESGTSDKEVEENDDAMKDLYKQTLSIMNRLTPKTFHVLVSQMQALKIDTEDKLKGVVDLFFDKAISEPDFSEVYANMCKCLSKLQVKSDYKLGKMVIFRAVLSARCQREFKEYRKIPDLSPYARKSPNFKDKSNKEELKQDLESEEAKAKRRSLGNIRFMGELFKLKMISPNIMYDCVLKLLRAKDIESLKCVCRLLTTIGKELDTDKDKPRMDQYFQQMTKIANDKKSSKIVRFMLQDVINVRLSRGLSSQSNRQNNESGPPPCEMTKPIIPTKVVLHKATQPWKPRCLRSGTSKKGGEENNAALKSRGMQSKPSQTNMSGHPLCQINQPMKTSDLVLPKAKKPWKPNISKSGTGEKEVEENAADIKTRRKPRKTKKSGPPPRIINLSILRAEVALHKAKNPWKPRRLESGISEKDLDENDAVKEDLYKKTQNILNKLTPQKFQVLVTQMKALTIDKEDKLRGVVDLVFEKAISEPYFSEVYANMCKCLSKLKVKSDSKPGKMVIFRVVLLERCQHEFKPKCRKIPVLSPHEGKSSKDECIKEELKHELAYMEAMAKRRSLGNIRFMGELFKLKMMSQNSMHDCVFKLLRAKDPESLACLCRLITTIGKQLDTEKAELRMDQYFEEMAEIADDKKNSARVRFMLEDVISVRLNKWIPRYSDNNPKTIDEIHMEIAQERHEEELQKSQKWCRRCPTRGQNVCGGGRHGTDGWNILGNQTTSKSVDRSPALGSSEEGRCLRNPKKREALGNRRGWGGYKRPRSSSARRLQKQESKRLPQTSGRSAEGCGQQIPVTHPTRGKGRDGGGSARTFDLKTRLSQEKIIQSHERSQGHTEAAQCFVEKGLDNTKVANSTPVTKTTSVTSTEIMDRLHDLIVVQQEDNETVFNWIESNVEHATTAKSQFIRELMTAVCKSAIAGEKGNEKLEPNDISRRSNLLRKYLDHKALFELQALFAQQMLVTRIERPQGPPRGYFYIFYDEDVITEDAFIEGEDSENEPEGKKTSLKQVVQFFEWLKGARADS